MNRRQLLLGAAGLAVAPALPVGQTGGFIFINRSSAMVSLNPVVIRELYFQGLKLIFDDDPIVRIAR